RSTSPSLNQLSFKGYPNKYGSVFGIQFQQQVFAVAFDRFRTQEDSVGYFTIGQSLGYQFQHFPLPLAEPQMSFFGPFHQHIDFMAKKGLAGSNRLYPRKYFLRHGVFDQIT